MERLKADLKRLIDIIHIPPEMLKELEQHYNYDHKRELKRQCIIVIESLAHTIREIDPPD